MALKSRITLIAALALAAFQAQAVNVTVAYQTSAEPAKVAQADNTFAKTSGATVDWRKFDSGASVVRAASRPSPSRRSRSQRASTGRACQRDWAWRRASRQPASRSADQLERVWTTSPVAGLQLW